MSLIQASYSYLDGINTVILLSFDLSYLAPINLYNGTRNVLAPTVPVVCHTYLIPHEANSSAISLSWLRLLNSKLRIDLMFIYTKTCIFTQHSGIINRFGLQIVLHAHFMKC